MGLNETPSGERIHISIFGNRNVGKSSLINALTGQDIAAVSDVLGTTTDPVSKAMELLPLGPVMITDTAGLDDDSELADIRMKKSLEILYKTDFALIVGDCINDIQKSKGIISKVEIQKIPYVIVKNKSDLIDNVPSEIENNVIYVSAKTGFNIDRLKEYIATSCKQKESEQSLIEGLISKNELAVLVVPIDKSAPKGRLILPQQQTIRAILDVGGSAIICRDEELLSTLQKLSSPPKIVITDSQAFKKVAGIVDAAIPLTSFSILFARYKGDLDVTIKGTEMIDELEENDKILIAEGCSHHKQCDDIGTVKIPAMLQKYTGKKLQFTFTNGMEFPSELLAYRLVIHCGGCMLTEREMKHRINVSVGADIPITNYGMVLAKLNGILERSLAPVKKLL